MKIGYARVSTLDQNHGLQIKALEKAGCNRIFAEKISGKSRKRPELEKMLEHIRSDDVLIVTKLDRLARSVSDLVAIMAELKCKGAGFLSLAENMDLSTPQGRLQMNLFASIAEFERDLIVQRTKEGLAHAKARGRIGGRRPVLSDLQKKTLIKSLERKELSIKECVKAFKVSESTIKRVWRDHNNR